MTVPSTGGSITKQSMADDVNASIIDPLNAIINWSNSNTPFYPYGAASGSYQYTDPAAPGLGPSSYSQSTTADYPDTNVTASTIVNAYIYYAGIMSRVRSVRLLKYYNPSGYFYDATAYTSLSGNQSAIGNPGIIGTGSTVSVSGLSSLLSNLYSQSVANRDSTLTYTEYWCHSSCHSSYGARGRR